MKKSRIIYLLLIVLLSGCEGYTSYQIDVVNRSSSAVYLEGNTFYADSIDTLLQTNKRITIFLYDQRGGNSDPGKASYYIDSLLIFSDFDTISKDYRVSENWLIDSKHVKKVPSEYSHHFTFEVLDDDF